MALLPQLGLGLSPTWIELLLQGVERSRMVMLAQMTDFVRHHVIDTFGRRLDQVWIQRDDPAG